MATAQVQAAPPQIALQWTADPNATRYEIRRKLISDNQWGPPSPAGGTADSFTDTSVTVAQAYEYQIIKLTSAGYTGYGYICAAIDLPIVPRRGRVLLLVDTAQAALLFPELRRLEFDLAGDGWAVSRHDVPPSFPVAAIKRVVQSTRRAHPELEAVFLLGRLAVPYSGDVAPDDHLDHTGAWSADLFYGETDGPWTDQSVTSTNALEPEHWNLPGDGKYDQNSPPSPVDLQIGRVDFSRMTCFLNKPNPATETDLLRRYLDKNHNFRHAGLRFDPRALVCDNLYLRGADPMASSGWRNFSALVSPENIQQIGPDEYLPVTTSQSFLWSYASGGGSHHACLNVASADDFATQDPRVAFGMFLGSYMGHWDVESSFLRAFLGAKTSTLASIYAGFPHVYFQHMAVGQTLGYGIRIAQNNAPGGLYPPFTQAAGLVHLALLGDPTLRLHQVAPPSSLVAQSQDGSIRLSWNASPEPEVAGYYVFAADEPAGPFTAITPTPVQELSYTAPDRGDAIYMVRALKIQRSTGGTYSNLSQGIFAPAALVPEPPASLSATLNDLYQVHLVWTNTGPAPSSYEVQRRHIDDLEFASLGLVSGGTHEFIDGQLDSSAHYVYRVRALNDAGASPHSNETSALTEPAPPTRAAVHLIRIDNNTQGSWIGRYGTLGAALPGDPVQPAPSVNVQLRRASWFTWAASTTDPRALQHSDWTTRYAACWFNPSAFLIDVTIQTTDPLQVALYFMDWDRIGRLQTIDVFEATTGKLLLNFPISQYGEGRYLVLQLSGHVLIRVTDATFHYNNAVLSGIFFDPAPPPLMLRNTQLADGRFRWAVTGPSEARYVIESTTNFQSWLPITTNLLSNGYQELEASVLSSSLNRYYRCRLNP